MKNKFNKIYKNNFEKIKNKFYKFFKNKKIFLIKK